MLRIFVLGVALSLLGWLQAQSTWAAGEAGLSNAQPGRTTQIEFARGLAVEVVEGATLLTVRGPVKSWSRGGEPVFNEMKLVLLRRGDDSRVQLPDAWRDAVQIRVPVDRIAVNSQAEEAFLRELGQEDKLVAVGGNKSYDDALREKVLGGQVLQVGYSWHSPPNLDVLLISRADVFVMRLSDLDHAPSLARSNKLGVPTLPYFIDAESTYLGRAEWIKLFGLLTGTESRANSAFAEIKRNAEKIKLKAGGLPDVPALWAYPIGRDRWFAIVRGVEAELLEDAGALNLLRTENDVMQDAEHEVSTESLLIRGRTAERWIIGDSHAAAIGNPAMLERIPAFRDDKLYTNNGRAKPALDAFDQYERGFVRPDLVLMDLFALLHEKPGALQVGFVVPVAKASLLSP